jgi:signal transduction histidine kinase/CheY-like chemotaxis protein
MPFAELVVEEDRNLVLTRYEARIAGEDVPKNYSFRLRNRYGEDFWLDTNSVLIDWRGRPATMNFIRDITEQKRLETQLQHAQKMEAVGTLAGGVAHDFNNVLQAIKGYAELLLLDKEEDAPGYPELQEISRAAGRGGELIRQLLTFSRKVETRKRPLNLNHEVGVVRRLLERTIPKMIEIELRLADTVRIVNADPAQIEQVLMNLAVNARDAMPEGGKLVIETKNVVLDEAYCTTQPGAKPGEYVFVSISDTGCGMDKETLEHIFEPFYTTKGVGEGTGLGLAMVYGIVKHHGGYINCRTEPGEGTSFEIYFPVIDQQGTSVEREETNAPLRGGTETILLVDDEQSLRNLGKELFTKYGYTVLTAADGERALELYRNEQRRIDLVILDLLMPGMGGQKCMEELLLIDPQARILMASGFAPDGPTRKAIEAGARGFVSKPFDISQILQKVWKVLNNR